MADINGIIANVLNEFEYDDREPVLLADEAAVVVVERLRAAGFVIVPRVHATCVEAQPLVR